MHASEIKVVSSCHILLVSVRSGGGGGGVPRKSTPGGEFFLRIFSHPEKFPRGGSILRVAININVIQLYLCLTINHIL